jgi:hypothetical protein
MKQIRCQPARTAYALCIVVQGALLVALAFISAIATTNTRLQARDAPAQSSPVQPAATSD